jgi:hypothetical protein
VRGAGIGRARGVGGGCVAFYFVKANWQREPGYTATDVRFDLGRD